MFNAFSCKLFGFSVVLLFSLLTAGSALTAHLFTEKSPFDFPENRIQDLYVVTGAVATYQRLNMELDLQSFFGIQVKSCTHCIPQPPNLPAFGLICEGAIGQPR